jgi:3-oxoacyl-[acyl-carrier protein] reductase
MLDLNGKTALVTGASRGIGKAAAVRLARQGAFVIVHYGTAEKDAHAVVDQIKTSGGKAIALQADLADPNQVERLAGAVRTALREHTGAERLDILVNNAGIAPFVGFRETDNATLDRVLQVNVKAPYQLTARLADTLPDGGRVIFVTTAVTKTFFPGIAAYAASKGAIDTLILHLAAELGPRGVRVTGVAPGAIETDMSAWLGSEDGKKQAHAIQALQRIGKPDDIARVIAFLAGPDGDWVTGHIVTASGGTKL